jgi:ubiquinone/menaquinone biosynthesis C-methylase UbiE
MSEGGFQNQFGHPHGLAGHVAGWLMALSNRELNTWAVDLLHIRPDDRVLEIGFGPGLGIQELARRARRGRICGVDISPLMLRQAAHRNAAAVRSGHVVLREAGVSALPFEAASLEKVLAVNNVQFWPRLDDDLREVARVLVPGGVLAVVLQPRHAPSEEAILAARDELLGRVRASGYTRVESVVTALKPMPAFAVLGRK